MEETSNVEEVSGDIRDIFCKYKEKQKIDLCRTLNAVKCCECGHKARIQNVQTKLMWYKRMTFFYKLVLGALSVFLLLSLYLLWAARRYNLTRSFGNGACVSTFLWTYDDCMVYH